VYMMEGEGKRRSWWCGEPSNGPYIFWCVRQVETI
jgi:hypothetical protein